MFNWAVYSYNVHKTDSENTTTCMNCEDNNNESQNHFVSLTDLLVPMALSLALSLMHSQIVATASSNALTSSKQRKHSGDLLQPGGRKRRERRKRKKHVRMRSALNCPLTEQITSTISKKSCLAGSNRRMVSAGLTTDNSFTSNTTDTTQSSNGIKKIVKIHPEIMMEATTSEQSPQLRKRNVYWDSPIKSQVSISAKMENDSNDDCECAPAPTENERGADRLTAAADDDGFESLNGKSSSGEEMTAGHVDVEAINDDIVDSTTNLMASAECDAEGISNGNAKVSLYFAFFLFVLFCIQMRFFLFRFSSVIFHVFEIFQLFGRHCRYPQNSIQKLIQVKLTRMAMMSIRRHRQHCRHHFRKAPHRPPNGLASQQIAKSAVTVLAIIPNHNWSIRKMVAPNLTISHRLSS